MNERIDKLFEQALEEFMAENKYATIIVPDPLKEKFAQLIVRECIGIANNHNSEVEGVTLGVGRTLKQHFGVEE